VQVQQILDEDVLYVHNIVYPKLLQIVDDEMLNVIVLLLILLDDEQHEQVKLMMDVLMMRIYYNDQDIKMYEEINHL
jgi:hypothetical protein